MTPVPAGAGPLEAADLAQALQDALADVRVEVDLGAVESVVADAVRTALAELPAGPRVASGSPPVPDGGPGPVPKIDGGAFQAQVEGWARSAIVEALQGVAGPGRDRAVADVAYAAGLDPVDVARRLAASVLSPKEIAGSLALRLQPLLEDQALLAARAVVAESARERAELRHLVIRLSDRLERLETELHRSRGPAPDER